MKDTFLAALLFIVGSLSLSAQSIFYNHGQDNFLRLELNRPAFSYEDVHFLSFDSYLSGEFRVGKKNKIAFELPYSRFSVDFNSDKFVSSGFGNVAVAFQFRNLLTPNYFQVKLEIPTANGDVSFNSLSDFTERLGSFIPDVLTIEGSYNLESKNLYGLYFRTRPGLKILISTSDNGLNDAYELLLNMHVLGGYRTRSIDFSTGITTTSILSESGLDFTDRLLRQFSSYFTYNGGAIKPGCFIRIPISDVSENVYDYVLGVHLTYAFGSKSLLEQKDSADGR